jgi:hypothetical protein
MTRYRIIIHVGLTFQISDPIFKLARFLALWEARGNHAGAGRGVLAALGLTPDGIQLLLRQRRIAPLNLERLAQLASILGPAGQFLRLEGNTILTIRATDQWGTVGEIAKHISVQPQTPIVVPPGGPHVA